MGVQTVGNVDTTQFILYDYPAIRKDDGVFLQDAGRVIPLEPFTLVAKIAATGKYVPYSDETAVDGTAIPAGIYIGDQILAADLVAGDVVDAPILLTGVRFADSKLVIESAKTLATIIAVGTINARTVEDELMRLQLIPENVIDISNFENS
ncbi:MAG: head decoration protein [Thermoplasmata archaeon]|nr:head decoration protein [Thermoplasmata archaeon]